jgi:hypothetical protein
MVAAKLDMNAASKPGEQEAHDANGNVLQHDRQNFFKVRFVHRLQLRHAERQRQHRDARDHHVTREHQHHVTMPFIRHASRGIARGENALHVVVRRGTGQTGQHALEEHQAEDDEKNSLPSALIAALAVSENAVPIESLVSSRRTDSTSRRESCWQSSPG